MESVRQDHSARRWRLAADEDPEASSRAPQIIGLDGLRAGASRQSGEESCRLAQEAIQQLTELHAGGTEQLRGLGDNRPDGITPEDVVEFSRLILKRDSREALEFMDQLRDRGAEEEELYLDLLAPTARRLGDLWVADLCDFTEVTIGLGRLQHAMHALSFDFHRNAVHLSQQRRILLLPAPGEQHTMGLLMVGEFFRRSGWDVWSAPWSSREDMLAMVQHQWFPVVGLSISCDRHLDELARGIRRIRKESRNKAVGIMVGGPLVLERPEVVARVGADATATDARDAAVQAEKLLDQVVE